MALNDFSSTYSRDFRWLLVIFAALYFFELANFPLSIDEELAAFRKDASVWVAQGRWAAFLIEHLLLDNPTIPFVPPMMFGLGCAVGYILILDAARDRQPLVPHEYLAFPIFCAYPSWFFITEFYSNLFGIGIALIFSSLAVWLLLAQFRGKSRWVALFAAIVAGAVATGIYQSFILLTAGCVIGVILLRHCNGRSIQPWKDTLVAVAALLGSVIVYAILDKVFRLFVIAGNQYFDSIFDLSALFSSPLLVAGRIAANIANAYGLVQADFGTPLWAAVLVIALGTIAAVRFIMTAKSGKPVFVIGALLAVLMLPFALQIIAAGKLPYRSLTGIAIAVWLFAILPMKSTGMIRVAGFVATALLVFQIIVTANTYQAVHYFSMRKDLLLAGAIGDRIIGHPDYEPNFRYTLVLYGAKRFTSEVYPHPRDSTMGRSFFEWDGGNPGRISRYLELLGYPHLSFPSQDNEIENINLLASMPVFPKVGSVVFKDNVILLRLAQEPEWRDMQTLERAKALDSGTGKHSGKKAD